MPGKWLIFAQSGGAAAKPAAALFSPDCFAVLPLLSRFRRKLRLFNLGERRPRPVYSGAAAKQIIVSAGKSGRLKMNFSLIFKARKYDVNRQVLEQPQTGWPYWRRRRVNSRCAAGKGGGKNKWRIS